MKGRVTIMTNITEIIGKYSSGEKTLEETNEALKAAGSTVYLDPDKNVITEEEIKASTFSENPEECTGYGLLDSGTGSLDKSYVEKGTLRDVDMGESYALFIFGGVTFTVKGKKIVKYEPYKAKTTVLPKTPDMKRRNDLAGQEVVQETRSGKFTVKYDELGYAVSATRVKK
jgi:hypothetical protein